MKKLIFPVFIFLFVLLSCTNEKNNSNAATDSTIKNSSIAKVGEDTTIITTSDYKNLVVSNKIVLVDIGAKWCVYCKKLAPLLDDLVSSMPGKFLLVKSDSDRDSNLADSLNISSLPTLLLYKNGILTWRNEGFIDEDAIREKISN